MKKLGIVFAVLCLLAGCAKTEYSGGQLEQNKYQNNFFHFELTFPDTYSQFSEKRMAAVLGISLEELQSQSATETKYEFMISNELNSPLFQFYVEKYKFTPVTTFDDFIAALVNQFEQQEEIEYAVGKVQELTIHDVNVHKIELHANAGYYVLNQDIYLLKEQGYVGTLMVTYLDEQKEEVEQIIQTIQFVK